MHPLRQIIYRPPRHSSLSLIHPWVMRSTIVEPSTEIPVGEVVDLTLADGTFLGRGVYHPTSRIAVRLYSWNGADELDDAFFVSRLATAVELREPLAIDPTHGAVRLCFSEADLLSGLIVDRYAEHIVIQQTASSFSTRLPAIVQWLAQRFSPKSILLRVDEKTAAAESMQVTENVLYGEAPQGSVQIQEHGIRLEIDLIHGQKTGYYLDQRDNRLLAARAAHGRVLDVCCFLGGFSMAIRKWGKASEIIAVDTSAKVIEQAKHQANLNGLSGINFQTGDCFDTLKEMRQQNQSFDTIILDPPRLVSSRSQLEAGMRAYHRLNCNALELLEPGGILVTCSCSGRVTREEFHGMLKQAAQRAGRQVQLIQQLGAAPDHPVLLSCPETDYLKCFICRVL